jgi:hypothetical protein
MIVAGGVYLEHCIAPPSDSLLGSAGRAALGLSGLTSSVELHTFFPAQFADQIPVNFEPFGVKVHMYPSPSRVGFQYLHPLARPRVYPIPLPKAGTVDVRGDVVLRFGCLEGDFRVKARAAVYDPQTATAPVLFTQNGSAAERLALILNRAELLALTGVDDLQAAAEGLMQRERAAVTVVKSGPAGAFIFADGASHHVPAFECRGVFKIGSGDVFTAAFTHYWAERNHAPEVAARLASLHVAEYVETRRLIFVPPRERVPLTARPVSKVGVWCRGQGASNLWLKDEILTALGDLGLIAETIDSLVDWSFNVLFIALPGADNTLDDLIATAREYRTPIVIYGENLDTAQCARFAGDGLSLHTDLATALYRAAWA